MSLEVKELIEGIKADHDQFKKAHDKLLESKADGKAVGDLETKVAALNAALDKKTARLDQIETALKRTPSGSEAERSEVNERVLRKAFRTWMSKGDKDSSLSDAIMQVFEKHPEIKTQYMDLHPETKALAVQDDTSGGYMVHADLNGRIIKRLFETSPIRSYAAVATISTDALEGPRDFDQGTATWVAEEGARGDTATPKIGMWRIPTHELYAMPAATQKLLDDAAWDPETWLSAKIADKFARTENAAFVNGTGVGQPKGFLQEVLISDAANASASYDNYIQDSKIGYIPSGVAGAFPLNPAAAGDGAVGNPLIDLVYALKTQYRDMPGTAFGMHRTTYAAVRKLRDLFGNYLWQPGFNGQPATLFGYPIAEFNDMPILAANSLSIAFANWREAYQIVDRIGIRVLRDPYTSKPFIKFYTTKRTGGATLNFEAIKLMKFAAS